MRIFAKPIFLLIAAVNVFLLAIVLGQGDSSSSASELMPFRKGYQLDSLLLTNRVASLVDHQYVDPTRVKPKAMFESALDQVQREVPEVLFDYSPEAGKVTLWVDDYTETIDVGPMASVPDVVNGLRSTLRVVGERWTGDVDGLPDVEYAAINGMLQTLDPHSLLLPPDNAKAMDVQIQGQFGGLGITISLRGEDQTLTVISVLDGTPAKRSGLKAGDQILQIDGESTVNIDLNEAVGKLRGLVGSKVEVLVGRTTFETPTVFKIRRDLIKIESVTTEYLGDGIGLVQMKTFQHNTHDQLLEGLAELKKQGPIKGLILDLRNNPGGPLQQAVEVADRFIERGDLVTTVHSHTREKSSEYARSGGTEPPYPIAVVMDSSSASASEIVAGALKNSDRAIIIGETSFGKGSVQNLYSNPDDSKLKLTMLQYLTTGEKSIQSVGITPDVHLSPVYFGDEMVYYYSTAHIFRERDLETHLDADPIDYEEQDPSAATIHYYAPDEFVLGDTGGGDEDDDKAEDGEKKGDAEAEAKETEEIFIAEEDPDPLDDFQIRFTKDLLMKAGRGTRRGTLKQAKGLLKDAAAEQEQVIIAEMKKLGIDWSEGPAHGGEVQVALTHNGADGKATWSAGEEVSLTLTATNNAKTPLYRLRGVTDSELPLFNQTEFLFGKLEPGESRSWTRSFTLRDNTFSLAEPVTFKVIQGESQELGSTTALLQIREKKRPALAFALVPIDDGSGESRGNGDGEIQPGETIDLLAMVMNGGDGPADRAFLKVSNQTGRALYLNKGTANFGAVEAGAMDVKRLNFEVQGSVPEDTLHMGLRGGDAIGMGRVNQDITLKVNPGVQRAVDSEKLPGTLKDTTLIRPSAMAEATPFATLPKGAAVVLDGRLPGYERIHFKLGEEIVPGWVAEGSVTKGAGDASQVELAQGTPITNMRAPSLKVSVPAYDLPASMDTLRVKGAVEDDSGIHSMYAFVNDKKRYFKAVPKAEVLKAGAGVTYPFDMSLPLEPGTNLVEIWVHDDSGLKTVDYLQVYREPTVAAAAK